MLKSEDEKFSVIGVKLHLTELTWSAVHTNVLNCMLKATPQCTTTA